MEPLQEGEEVTDTTGKKWQLGKRLSQSATELIYEGETVDVTSGEALEIQINGQLNSCIILGECKI